MIKVSKKLVVCCIMGGILICQPITMNGLDWSPAVVKAHSSHHADSHHNYGYTDNSDPYYYCGGHEAHLHDGGVCPYSDPYYYCDGHEAHLHDGGVCPYSLPADGSSYEGTVQSSSSSRNTILDTSGKTIELSTGESVAISKDMIRLVQDALNQRGYDCGTADGVIGIKTKEAIQKYLGENENQDTDCMIISMIAEGLGIQEVVDSKEDI